MNLEVVLEKKGKIVLLLANYMGKSLGSCQSIFIQNMSIQLFTTKFLPHILFIYLFMPCLNNMFSTLVYKMLNIRVIVVDLREYIMIQSLLNLRHCLSIYLRV
jgi:hypothetical protein